MTKFSTSESKMIVEIWTWESMKQYIGSFLQRAFVENVTKRHKGIFMCTNLTACSTNKLWYHYPVIIVMLWNSTTYFLFWMIDARMLKKIHKHLFSQLTYYTRRKTLCSFSWIISFIEICLSTADGSWLLLCQTFNF